MRKKIGHLFRKYRWSSMLVANVKYFLMIRLGLDIEPPRRHPEDMLSTLLPESLRVFTTDEQKAQPKVMKQLTTDILYSSFRYRITPTEYFLFHFSELSDSERSGYLGTYDRPRIMNQVSTEKSRHYFRNKFLCYETFRSYYGREIIEVKGSEDLERLRVFAAAHPKFIVKPVESGIGRGIFVVNLEAKPQPIEAVLAQILQEGTCVIEEMIEQAPEMAQLHPGSVNTIRYVTFLKDGQVTTLFAMLRMGCGGSAIDNAGAGGLIASIDVESGITKTVGFREDGTEFPIHPDTGIQLLGFQVPEWEACREFAAKLAKVVPEQQYVGWDLALTKNGWVMVEGNNQARMTGIQMSEKRGIRKEVEHIILGA